MIGYLLAPERFPHTLAALLLLARLGDVGSTYLVSPRLVLEANPVVRRLGWPFAALTLLLAGLAYVHTGYAVAVLAASLLVTSSNLARGWVARALGEAETAALQARVARRIPQRHAHAFVLGAAAAAALAALVLFELSGAEDAAGGQWFALGLFAYALAIGVHGNLHVRRVFRAARAAAADSGPAAGGGNTPRGERPHHETAHG